MESTTGDPSAQRTERQAQLIRDPKGGKCLQQSGSAQSCCVCGGWLASNVQPRHISQLIKANTAVQPRALKMRLLCLLGDLGMSSQHPTCGTVDETVSQQNASASGSHCAVLARVCSKTIDICTVIETYHDTSAGATESTLPLASTTRSLPVQRKLFYRHARPRVQRERSGSTHVAWTIEADNRAVEQRVGDRSNGMGRPFGHRKSCLFGC